ncbi:MAG: GntR family transcriptional regulator [Ruminococcus sp.]|uniref:GntR family transcriptional regulator n=1 Tax=Ruminococcus sp. TaxID=41978 RepID=UPI0025FEA38C|nr:GntR family transcriptional regulator [Ruminococcus sp.]MBR5683179.1 GntR family transcriptional regulator [Ruminococcus sp.]
MFSIDLTSRIPIYEQIYQKIVMLILNGTLAENDQLPSVRSLAKSTGVNPNTVSKAYQELERNGVIYSVPGRGSFVSAQNFDEFRKKVMIDFDATVNEAFERGISPEDLKARIDTLFLSYRKEDRI